jgi:hypothetical protein
MWFKLIKFMKIRFAFCILISLHFFSLFAQVSIFPEIGVNYRPYVLNGLNTEVSHNLPELLFGFNTEVFLTSKLSLQNKISYIFRKNNSITSDLSANPDYKGGTFINRDLSISLGLLYPIRNNMKIGVGGGFFHKLNSYTIIDYTSIQYKYGMVKNILFNAHLQIVYKLGNFRITTMYQYLFNSELESVSHLSIDRGRHSVTGGISYELFKSKKKQ